MFWQVLCNLLGPYMSCSARSAISNHSELF